MPKVYIVILNYQNSEDTIECIESLLKLDYTNFSVVIVDNNSKDNSVENIKKWLSNSSRQSFEVLQHSTKGYTIEKSAKKINLIENFENRGYAAGNNVGIAFAKLQSDFEYVWILNNDVIAEKSSLNILVKYFENSTEKLGILGTKIYYYHSPKMLQYAGGAKYYKCFGFSKAIGHNEIDEGQYDTQNLQFDMISGASMFASRQFIEEVGLLYEGYFLYSEEIDWAVRGKKKGFSLGFAPQAKVYHKVSATTNESQKQKAKKTKSLFTDYYVFRSAILFTKRFYPFCLFTVYLLILAVAFKRLLKKKPKHTQVLLKMMLNPKKHFPQKA